MSARDSLFSVGDRVKLDNGESYESRWFHGTIEAVVQGTTTGYRVNWDDGYSDGPGAPLYFAHGLQRV